MQIKNADNTYQAYKTYETYSTTVWLVGPLLWGPCSAERVEHA